MAAEEFVELKFRLPDGTDIGPRKYTSTTTVGSLKEKILAEWPKDKKNGPKAMNDLKIIYGGKVLEDNITIAESRAPFGDLDISVITMHVVIQHKDPELIQDDPISIYSCIYCIWIFIVSRC